jgi:HECT-domain (ubiquitin-transferase)
LTDFSHFIFGLFSGGDHGLTLKEVLVFATAADCIPSLGFPETPTIVFNHRLMPFGMRKFPTANTCALELFLPVVRSYELFVEAMSEGVVQSPTFGFQ